MDKMIMQKLKMSIKGKINKDTRALNEDVWPLIEEAIEEVGVGCSEMEFDELFEYAYDVIEGMENCSLVDNPL